MKYITTNNFFDFNNVEPYNDTPKHVEINRDEIEAELLAKPEEFCCWLYPELILEKNKGYIGNVSGSSGQSLHIDLRGPTQGRWYDFASGTGGGDFIGLYIRAKGYSSMQFTQALQDLAGWASIAHTTDQENNFVRRSRKARKRRRADIGKAVNTYYYHDPKGNKISEMRRHEYIDHKGSNKKEFIPYTYDGAGGGVFKMPVPRHIYNAHLLNSGDQIVFCEGEKTADAITALNGYVGTTVMGGALAIDQSDYSSLEGKEVILWRDNDPAGKSWQTRLSAKLQTLRINQTGAVIIPEGMPDKWDAADCAQDVAINLLSNTNKKETGPSTSKIKDWEISKYLGQPNKIQWLFENIIPLGVPCILASMGGIGKSFKVLEMGISIASEYALDHNVLGGPVSTLGACVIITGEDSRESVHRRLASLLTDEEREELAKRNNLFIMPTVSAGGSFFLVAMENNKPIKTPQYYDILEQLLDIKDLRLIVIDPLQMFVGVDINKDPAMGQFLWSALGEICTQTGATLLATHHMSKGGGKPIKTVEEARNAIRGSTALIDGPRVAYALWNAEEQAAKDICKTLEIEHERDKVIFGAVVKANDLTDKSIHKYIRTPEGLLKDATIDIKDITRRKNRQTDQKLYEIFGWIHKAWNAGEPLSHFVQAKRSGRYLPRIIASKGLMTVGGACGNIKGWLDVGLVEVETCKGASKRCGLKVTEKGMKFVKEL